MSRWKAAGIHLGISLIIAALVGAVIYFIWYPPPYFTVAGGSTLMLLIMGVDVVIGPLLTLAVFQTNKRGLKFDLTVIAFLQATAFSYGLWVIASARPVFIVAAIDRLVPVYANQLEDADLAQAAPEFGTRSWTGPRLVGVRATKEQVLEIVMSSVHGRDIEKLPKYYVAYDEIADALLKHASPLDSLASKQEAYANEIKRLTGPMPDRDLAYLPLVGRHRSYTAVISRVTKRPVGVLNIDPW